MLLPSFFELIVRTKLSIGYSLRTCFSWRSGELKRFYKTWRFDQMGFLLDLFAPASSLSTHAKDWTGDPRL